MNLTNEQILSLCSDRREYFRGLELQNNNSITALHCVATEGYATAEVDGDNHAEVFYNTNSLASYSCSCQYFAMQKGACRHIVALLKNLQLNVDENMDAPCMEDVSKSLVKNLISIKPYRGLKKIQIIVGLHIMPDKRGGQKYLDFRAGIEKMYIIKDIKLFIDTINSGGSIRLGKEFTFDASLHTLEQGYAQLFAFLSMIYELKRGQSDSFTRRVVVEDSFFLPLLEHMNGLNFTLMYNDIPIEKPFIRFEPLPIELLADKDNDSYALDFSSLDNANPLTSDCTVVYRKGTIFCTNRGQAAILKALYNAKIISGLSVISFADGEKTSFIAELLPKLRAAGKVKVSKNILDDCLFVDLRVKAYLDTDDETLKMTVKFCYEKAEFNHFAGEQPVSPNKVVIRDKKAENDFIILADSYNFTAKSGSLFLAGDGNIYNFISQGIKQLSPTTEFYISDSVKRMRVTRPNAPSGTISLSSGNLLEFEFDFGSDVTNSEFSEILVSVREKKRYHRLKDGSFLELESGVLEALASFIDRLDLQPTDIKKGKAKLSQSRAIYADSLIENFKLGFNRSVEFSEHINTINSHKTDCEIPHNLDGILRDYQKDGFKWFKTLSRLGLGGILADEMGLGKTIQAIAFVMSEYENYKMPTLIVCPTSLVYNWQHEIEKFAPNACVAIANGQPHERAIALRNSNECHFIITSYGNLRRDIPMYGEYSFAWCIVDEAQNIKNPGTINAKVVKGITAKGFFALTGTPLENNLTELWSIFDFIMPGYLHTRSKFKRIYELPIVKSNDSAALQQLLNAIQPFILRRLKVDVLNELPEKIETEVIAELGDEQKSLYAAYATRAANDIHANVEQHGFGSSRIKILAALTRLRQICCHPSMFVEGYQGGSGKLDLLMEIVEDAISSGRRLLIFSQFVSMLKIIENSLKASRIKYFYLDGGIKGLERIQMCDAFNKGQRDVFLISLKAGGTGLNLTGADMVVHFDPWWNPAVENQATDRAHRIGQTKAVQVIKLVAKGTIEEKIYEIQKRKQSMIDAVIETKSTPLFNMTYEEIKGLFE